MPVEFILGGRGRHPFLTPEKGSVRLPREQVLDNPTNSAGDARADIKGHNVLKLTPWEKLTYPAIHLVVSGMLKVFGVRGTWVFSRTFGFLEFLINYKRRRKFGRELSVIFPEGLSWGKRLKFCAEFFMYSRCNRMFYLIFEPLGRERVLEQVIIERKQLMDDALEMGKGVYVAMSHFGPYHIGAMRFALEGYPIAGVRERHEGGLRRYFQRRLDRKYPQFGRMEVLYSDEPPRSIYRALKGGYILGSALDARPKRNRRLRTIGIQIYGQELAFLKGPLQIAIRCGVPVLQSFVIPEPGFRYRVELMGPLYQPGEEGTEDELVQRVMNQYAKNVEHHMRTWPFHHSRA